MGTILPFPFLYRNSEVILVVLHIAPMVAFCEVSVYGKQNKRKITRFLKAASVKLML